MLFIAESSLILFSATPVHVRLSSQNESFIDCRVHMKSSYEVCVAGCLL